ncbi:MAG: hypothetical protein KJO12_07955, partial [Ignavibacteria bacterium]|nr:hypothetical protein [Ignavibacteria bacterium]
LTKIPYPPAKSRKVHLLLKSELIITEVVLANVKFRFSIPVSSIPIAESYDSFSQYGSSV